MHCESYVFLFSTFRALTNVNMSSFQVTYLCEVRSVVRKKKKLSMAKAKQGNRGQPKATDHHLQFFFFCKNDLLTGPVSVVVSVVG